MSTNLQQGITEQDIANYLATTPGFFERNAEMLGAVRLTSPHGQRAVSLQERQMEMLRDKIRGLELKIIEMIRNGQENVAIADKLHRWTRALMLTADAEQAARRAGARARAPVPDSAGGHTRVGRGRGLQPVRLRARRKRRREELRDEPDDAVLRRQFRVRGGVVAGGAGGDCVARADPDAPRRVVAAFGLLVLGSPDPTRYTIDMGTEFLMRIGDIASAGLNRLLPAQ